MTPLYGHDAAIAQFRAALDSGRLHHAWLLAGPAGIGKALFAEKAALRILAQGTSVAADAPRLDLPDDHPTERLAREESHPDLFRLERLMNESGNELARSIKISQIRELRRRFETKGTLSDWRVVIIDSVDDLERPGAGNALLKILEEPPAKSVFLLVSHKPEHLMPTVKSRCRMLRLSPLDDDAMASALRAALPDASEAEIADLVAVGEGAPGRAIAWRGLDIAALDRDMREIVRLGDPTNARRSKLADALASKSAQPRYEAFLARLPALIAEVARTRRGPALDEALRLWERASQLAGSARGLSLDQHSTTFELASMLAALSESERPAAA